MRQIYVHGLGQTPASWEKTISQLENKQEVLCPDLAELVKGKEVDYKNLYQAFAHVCDRIDGSVDLCGLSLGGVIVLNYAINHPQKVHSLVLIAAQYKIPGKLLQFQNILFRLMPSSIFPQVGFGKEEFLRLCRSMMELDFSKSLSNISCPTLVICGERDAANKKASAELAGILKHAELQVVKGSRHEINRDAPEKLAEMLRSFYKRV